MLASPAQFRTGPSTIMRRDAGEARISRILVEQPPDDLFGHGLALFLVASIHRAEYSAVSQAGRGGPGVDSYLDPGRHRYRADAAMLPDEVDDTPATVALLDMCE